MELQEKKIQLADVDTLLLFGYNDTNLQLLENRFDAAITVRGDSITMRGPKSDVDKIEKIFRELMYIIQRTGRLDDEDVRTVIDLITSQKDARPETQDTSAIIYSGQQDVIKARTATQRQYFEKARRNDVVFAIGPAGTGKTYLAVAMALAALRKGEVSRIVLSRPAVEAGESLGFLPGDLNEKIDPYLRPLLDALVEMLGPDKLKSLMEKRIVEIIPLAYMRGRTFNNCFIVLDEAQNTTKTQMKMFLTRLGRHSKTIITGDVTQVDLPRTNESGLVHVQSVLKTINGIDFVSFTRDDVVRHRLVAEIIDAYEKAEISSQLRDTSKRESAQTESRKLSAGT